MRPPGPRGIPSTPSLRGMGRDTCVVDTAGIRRKSRISLRLEKYSIVEALRSIDRCDVALLMLDAKEEVTDQDARIGGFIHEKGKGCVVVMNKWDLIEKDTETLAEFEERVREHLKYLSYAPIVFVSALTGQRVSKILDVVDHVAEEARKRITTSRAEPVFREMGGRGQPPSLQESQGEIQLYHPGVDGTADLCHLHQFPGRDPLFLPAVFNEPDAGGFWFRRRSTPPPIQKEGQGSIEIRDTELDIWSVTFSEKVLSLLDKPDRLG